MIQPDLLQINSLAASDYAYHVSASLHEPYGTVQGQSIIVLYTRDIDIGVHLRTEH